MSKRLSADDARLYRLCDEALYYLWDPIGVAGSPQARDEYYSYLPQVFRLVKARRRPELVAYLRRVSEEDMGLPKPDPLDSERTADFLFSAQEWIEEMADDRAATRDIRQR
jgi:hypothetical protein